jgi:hypothetical protein
MTMKIRPGTIVMSCILVVILASGVAFGFYLRQERIDRAPEEWAFFYENRELFEEVKDEFLILGVTGSINNEGSLIRGDGTRKWYPDLAAATRRLFERAPDSSRYVTGYFMAGSMEVEFSFSSNGTPKLIFFVYSENDLTRFGYERMERNWYYGWILTPS